MYQKELEALRKSSRLRERVIYDETLLDLASNDYLGFAQMPKLLDRAYQQVQRSAAHAPKASQLVNGYHPIHREFEAYLCERNGFEAGIVVGSGFLANLSLLEALPRKGDLLILDREYHASGIVGSRLCGAKVCYFEHNDPKDLARILESEHYHRAIVAVEGVYSMEGDLCEREIFEIAEQFGALLVVDEAHSAGVLGEEFLGIFEHYGIIPKANHIKMGTLGKAFGSYGAYILATEEIVTFLQNRAKAIIYATAPSIFDIALAYEGMKYLQEHQKRYRTQRQENFTLCERVLGIKPQSAIVKIEIGESQRVIAMRDILLEWGILVGAIRPPTVKKAIIRLILRLHLDVEVLEGALWRVKEVTDG